jgi:hypothetical protein
MIVFQDCCIYVSFKTKSLEMWSILGTFFYVIGSLLMTIFRVVRWVFAFISFALQATPRLVPAFYMHFKW